MPTLSSIRTAVSYSGVVARLVFEVGTAAIRHTSLRDRSKRDFRRTLTDQDLPPEAVEELSETYEKSLPSIRELVRSRGFR